jgi:TetR/AcrR family transcriptional regulator, cholesterol catabolism regulator
MRSTATKSGPVEGGSRPLGRYSPSVPPKSKQTRSEQLLVHAVELFSEGGYRETSLQDIASKLGITRPLFYYYFESKEDLLWQIIGHLGDDLLARARPIVATDQEPAQKLWALLERHADTVLRNVASFRIYFAERHQVTGKRERRLREGEDAYLGIVAQVIYTGQLTGQFKQDDARMLALLTTGMVNSMLRWFVPDGLLTIEEIAPIVAQAGVDAVRIFPESNDRDTRPATRPYRKHAKQD